MPLAPWSQTLHHLKNGVRVATVHLPHVERPQLCVALRAGPAFETDATWGLSHMVEHMVFRGADEVGDAKAVALAFDAFGGDANAATYRDRMVFESRCDAGSLSDAVGLLSAMLQGPRFNDFEIEKDIMREELLESLDDDDEDVDVDNLMMERLFPGEVLSRSIEGPLALLERRTLRELRAFHAQLLQPQDALILAVGNDLDDELLHAAQTHFGKWAATCAAPTGKAPKNRVRAHLGGQHADDVQTQVRLGFLGPGLRASHASATGSPGPGSSSTERSAMHLLLRILDDGPASRIQSDLVDARGLAYSLWASSESFVGESALEMGAEVHHQKAHVVVQDFCKLLNDIRRQGVSDDEVERAKRRIERDFTDGALDPEGVAEYMAHSLLFDLDVRPEKELQKSRGISKAHIQSFVQTHLDADHARVAFVGRLTRKQKDACKVALEGLR